MLLPLLIPVSSSVLLLNHVRLEVHHVRIRAARAYSNHYSVERNGMALSVSLSCDDKKFELGSLCQKQALESCLYIYARLWFILKLLLLQKRQSKGKSSHEKTRVPVTVWSTVNLLGKYSKE